MFSLVSYQFSLTVFKRSLFTSRFRTVVESQNNLFYCHHPNTASVRLTSTARQPDASYDIVISGGGLVGNTMACSLGTSGYLKGQKILLLEGGSPIQHQASMPEKYSNRVIAVNPGSVQLLSDLGVWNRVPRSSAVKRMQIWDALSPSAISFQQGNMMNDIFHIVENNLLLSALASRLSELDVEVMHKVKVTKYNLPKNPDELVQLELEDGRNLQTKLLIGADGFNSLVRLTMGVNYVSWNYNQHAIVANLRISEAMENIVAFQKFLPTGPIALLPLTHELSSLVWTVTPSMAEKLMELPEDRFTDQLNAALWDTGKAHPLVEQAAKVFESSLNVFLPNSGSIVQLPPSILDIEPGSRLTFPLGLGHASRYVQGRAVLVGDAAHRVHPLAGLGVNLGFGDVKCLTDNLETVIKNGNKIDYQESLYDYEAERQWHNVPIMAAIDGLNRLYSTSFMPLVLLRSLGLQFVDAVVPLKDQFIRMASR